MQTHSAAVKTATPVPSPRQQSKTEVESKDSLKNDPPVLFQAKLSVGAPDDPFEQEAEKVSSQVMDSYEQVTSLQRKLNGFGFSHTIQPLSIGARISKKLQRILFRTKVQKKCDECEKE